MPLIRPFGQRDQRIISIRITEAGVGVVILQRSDWPAGTVLEVPRADGLMFIREGWGELVEEEASNPAGPEEK
jgi:hypothetical protein